ncbi:HesB/YadR/YfhF family protein [Halalkalibacterium halodurans]|uniref:BH2252 protein n=2 Tax=Halalkalibacterium halodurans TaxID=86665 RepID=Q9KAN5_HALH5|nr:HesB/YadR/YfhF family protein [Halalkalibacterium halodurans]MDY7222804.1 HesB/YadR/YfhF family protein [Halalkalibacterium halodurans]MDY7242025.1 HesB/YadR/YfhF family protein [Halalkalibacterium halodurans]MED4080964.1 HesB/YadR/YfhF family protein [Halalkalibacterium halodurans]MED4085147.1 HesB/YadR/YfhF family protein [Halalkalibacterium halodurans]MED4105275.1 HesB/YadR/YfhF family protein [Halalkalibacterium halodurans]
MNIQITKPALQWFKDEFGLEGGENIRFYARYGGCGSIQSGFSLGISQETPKEIGAKSEVDGVTFYIENEDLWYFKDLDLKVKYSRKYDEIEFVYE